MGFRAGSPFFESSYAGRLSKVRGSWFLEATDFCHPQARQIHRCIFAPVTSVNAHCYSVLTTPFDRHVLKGETSKRNNRNETAETTETTETKRPKRNDRNDRNETTETKRPKRNDRNDRNETTETKRPKRNSRKYKLQEKWKTLKLMKFTGNFIEILRQLGCGSTGL
jgi:hypothetical protein